jgi:hypothetical protein
MADRKGYSVLLRDPHLMQALVTPPTEHQIRPDRNKTQAGRSPEELKGGLVPVRPVHH